MLPWLFASLRGYRIGWLPRDFVAGLMLAAIAIPGQLATARLAGMPPEALRLCRRLARLRRLRGEPLHVSGGGFHHRADLRRRACILGRRRHPALCRASQLLALMVGGILLVVGLLRAGWLATLLSIPVTTGFLAGIAIHIMVGELPTLLGISEERGHML